MEIVRERRAHRSNLRQCWSVKICVCAVCRDEREREHLSESFKFMEKNI